MTDGIRKALILPGAGARGAYQVGVLKALAEQLEPQAPCPFTVLSGTSAGAINAAVLASRAGDFAAAVARGEFFGVGSRSEKPNDLQGKPGGFRMLTCCAVDESLAKTPRQSARSERCAEPSRPE